MITSAGTCGRTDNKSLANQQDVPYQSLMKLYLAERIKRERPSWSCALATSQAKVVRKQERTVRKLAK